MKKREYQNEIDRIKKQLIRLIKGYSRSQANLWKEVFELAKKADQLRNFSSGRLRLATTCHAWAVNPGHLQGLQVNLNNGDLGEDQYFDHLTLGQLRNTIDLLDAREIMANLTEEIITLRANKKEKVPADV